MCNRMVRILLGPVLVPVLVLGLGATACGDDDGGNNTQDNNNAVSGCGDGVIDSGELCDGDDLDGQDCTTIGLGFLAGHLECNGTCDDWDTARCTDSTQLGDVTVYPDRIDDVLTNPGMGFADFHLGWWCNLPPVTFTPADCATRVRDNWPENYPVAGTSYFRWHWQDLEPARGQIDFDMIDAAIQSSNELGETLGFRVMVIDEGDTGLPQWLLDPPYSIAGQWLSDTGGTTTFWPDVRDTTFQDEHARFIGALGARYDDHPGLDHVDIGTAGCWGEWNTACLDNGGGMIGVYNPADAAEEAEIVAAYQVLVDDHLSAFATSPVVMLGIGSGGGGELDVFVHAIAGGAGWRVDCWGDWGIWGRGWNHHEDLYPSLIANATGAFPAFGDTWQHAPIQLEVCGTMVTWESNGWTTDAPDGEVYKTFVFALEQHASVLNAKSTDIPAAYVPAIDDLLRENGYRFTIDSFNHDSVVQAGGDLVFSVGWSNLGVAPHYLRRTLTYRLRSTTGGDEATFVSTQDTRDWLPGSWDVVEGFTAPSDLPAGDYHIDVALVDRGGTNPTTAPLPPLHLGVQGRGADGWYTVSHLTIE